MPPVIRVIRFSGGVTSWLAGRRVVDEFGPDGCVLLFADTCFEDADLYRFLHEAANNLGLSVTRIADGRTPYQVMSDERIIGNSRIDPCSKKLKRQLLDRWTKENCDLQTTINYVGLDWTEGHRLARLQARATPWRFESPLMNPPLLNKREILRTCRDAGMEPPRLYAQGFAHNNCQGACVKAGQAQWALLLRTNPCLYGEIEQWETDMRARVGDYSILKDRRGGTTKPLPLSRFRETVKAELFDKHEWGGCGCGV